MDTSKAKQYVTRPEVKAAFHVDNIDKWRSNKRTPTTPEQEAAWLKVNQHEAGLTFRAENGQLEAGDFAHADALRRNLHLIAGSPREGAACATIATVYYLWGGHQAEARDVAVQGCKTADIWTQDSTANDGSTWSGALLECIAVLLELGFEPLHEIGAAA